MNVIITGSTGMVGKAVLIECLEDVEVKKVLLINRSKIDIQHDKIEEILVKDYMQLESYADHFKEYDACFHCMGISSLGVSKEFFYKITFTYTQVLMDVLFAQNRGMVITYVSGTGTDSTENGKVNWANVKGKTENYILQKGFKDAYAFRPGVIIPKKGVKSKTKWYQMMYNFTSPFHGLFLKSHAIISSVHLGRAMLEIVQNPQENKFLENRDIRKIAED